MSDSIESMMDGVVYAVSPNFFEIYDRFETDEEALAAMNSNPNATIVGKLMAETKGLEIGDILAYKIHFNEFGWVVRLVFPSCSGFYTAKQIKGDEMGAVINWDSFDEARLNQKGTSRL